MATKIGIIGDGITARAIRDVVNRLPEFVIANNSDASLIIASPGIPPSQYPIVDAPIIPEIDWAAHLFSRPTSQYHPRLIGVTGTNGKTTVTAMISHILECPSAGNIGVPLITHVDVPGHEWVVVELSSFQLNFSQILCPEISVITNITPDHLAWHGTMDAYIQAKSKICSRQTESNHVIYWDDDTLVQGIVAKSRAIHHPFTLNTVDDLQLENSQLVGAHNKLNMAAAALACVAAGVSIDHIRAAIKTFRPVEHRIEFVSEWDGRRYYNDSKATNPDSTRVAVAAFEHPIQLIICGQDKGLDLMEFVKWVLPRVKSIICYGDVADRFIATVLQVDPGAAVYTVSDTQEAVVCAQRISSPGDVILFSPSQSSFDQFENYEARGRHFKSIVNGLMSA